MNEEEIKIEETEEIIKKNPVEDRMRNLSNAKNEAEKKATELEAKQKEVERERDFFKDFSGSISKYPAANEFQDAIKEKVMSGYTVEDATVSVLAKEGKLQNQAPQRQSPAGGSASNQMQSGGAKSYSEMTRDERRQQIRDAEASGAISLS